MTNEQAKSELMQIYGSLSEEKKMALDVLMAQADGEKTCGTCRNEDTYHCAECENKSDYERAQADGEYISKEKAIIQLSWDLSEVELPRIKESLDKLPSVAIPADKGLIRAIQSVIDSSDFPEDKVHRVELMIRGEIDG